MDKGKFSQPRSFQEEDRQIEEAFRQVTQKKPSRKPLPRPSSAVSEKTVSIPPEELLSEETDAASEETAAQELPIEDSIFQSIQHTFSDLPDIPDAPQESPEDREDGSFVSKALDFSLRHWKPILIGLCSAVGVMVTVLILLLTGSSSGDTEDRIAPNVTVAGIKLGGMTRQEAAVILQQTAAQSFSTQDMVVTVGSTALRLSPKDTGAALDVQAAVDAAYAYGRTGTRQEQEEALANARSRGHTVGVLPYLNLNTAFILQELETLAAQSILTQPSYGLEGPYPSLEANSFDPDSSQTLVLTLGTPGSEFDVQQLYNQILDAYSLHTFQVTAQLTQPVTEPEPADLQAIYSEVCVAPVDSRINMQTFQVIPGSYGYDFDLDAAQRQVDAAQYGQTLRIPMRFLEPSQIDGNSLFADTLSTFTLSADTDPDSLSNLRLACQRIDGQTVQPGQVFSFLESVGSSGFTDAPADQDSNSQVITGGGISRLSSALYQCAMTADMETVTRSAHASPTDFVDLGMDAYVELNGPDFKFRNNMTYPIQLSSSLTGSTLTVSLLGTDLRDTFIKTQFEVTDLTEPVTEYVDFPHGNAEGYLDADVIRQGTTGYTVKTYRQKYSRASGQLLSKDYEATTQYRSVSTLIARVAPPETTVPETEVPETAAPEETVPAATNPIIVVPDDPDPTVETQAATEFASESVPETSSEDTVSPTTAA